MAQITMDADRVKEMCDSAIEYYLNFSSDLNKKEDKLSEKSPCHTPSVKMIMIMNRLYGGYFAKEVCTLRSIKALAENTSPGIGVIWVSDSDMELLSKKLDERRKP